MDIDFFGNSSRTDKDRRKILKKEPLFSENYNNYGYDYFDNPLIGVGYGGYLYDGRHKNAVKKIINHYDLQKNSNILEIGCAKGYILFEFHKLYMNVVGIDVSKYAIENSKPELLNCLMHHDITKGIPYPDKYFDFALCKEVLPHISQNKLNIVIDEILRVSKNSFLEIQCISKMEDSYNFKKWDATHKICKTKEKWLKILQKYNYTRDYNFRILI